jgi:N-acetylneuraminic acid mutarotase
MQKKSTSSSAFFNPRAVIVLLLCIATACSIWTGTLLAVFRSEVPAKVSHRTLTFAERVAYQRAIEEVYWRHRIWPKERPDPKPSLDAMMSQAQLAKKVEDYLRNSQALEDYWQQPMTLEQLQAEMDRMAQHTKQPEVLRELFAAMSNDPFIVAECLAKPALAQRLVANFYSHDQRIHHELKPGGNADPLVHARLVAREKEPLESLRGRQEYQLPKVLVARDANYALPRISDGAAGCTDDTWTATSTANTPAGRYSHTAVWTGSEMIVWGGESFNFPFYLATGGRYNPSTDTWTPTNTMNAPNARTVHTAVWTGSEMIVWGGHDNSTAFGTGGRYDPGTDSWTATSTTNAPLARYFHTAVWTGSEMIVWGGEDQNFLRLNTGGRYNPNTDSWTASSTTNAPSQRYSHTAVWTGNEMIIWGGTSLNTGGRYNPSTDSWVATGTTNAPTGRDLHTAVWTGSEMIVWGGIENGSYSDTGGKYNPGTDSWTATSTTGAPSERANHTAVWTDREMIVWGGTFFDGVQQYLNTGGRYNPSTDTWTPTNTINAPTARADHTAAWTGSEMIVWGGYNGSSLNTGGRYCAQSGPTPTPTPTPGEITLSARGYKVQGQQTVDLSWNGVTSNNIDVYRNGVLIATVPNIPGFYTDHIGARGKGTYTYRVCDAGTQNCSNQVTVRFGGGG